MTNSNDPEIEGTGLSEADYTDQFILHPKTLIPSFLVVFIICGGLLYWFQSTMQSNSNLKVAQARNILKRAQKLPQKQTPLTIELEQFAHETDDERNYILKKLAADSFTRHFDERLKKRFFRQTTYLQLPTNWKTKLPPKLNQWADRQRNERKKNIREFLEWLEGTLDELEYRINRLKTVRDEKNLKVGQFGGDIRRYENVKRRLTTQMEDVRNLLKSVKITSPNLPPKLFRNINDLIDPMSFFAMHTRNFSAFSSAPAAYYHTYRILHDAIRIDPDNPAPYYWLGKLFYKLKLDNVAGQFMARALHFNPDYKRDTILSHFHSRLEENPDSPQRNYYLGFALYEAGKKQEAKEYLRKVLVLEQGTNSMIKVLARKRLDYIRTGEPYYSKLPLY